ncbi:cytochrome-c oxidase [Virgibacillus byunsanensis]|uniref:Cytochrome-c oxidase n=1 Tax=Virgibacillus byunsanensis TaxID=570945 RepID=A0ABW3LN32_9BACI
MASRFIKVAVVYFVIGVMLGLTMGITQNFAYTSVHAHVNLLGWVSMALFGISYFCYPKAAESGLAKVHFWLHNIGLPLMQGTLFVMLLTSNHSIVVLTIIGSIMIVVGAILFLVNIFRNVNREGVSSISEKKNIVI